MKITKEDFRMLLNKSLSVARDPKTGLLRINTRVKVKYSIVTAKSGDFPGIGINLDMQSFAGKYVTISSIIPHHQVSNYYKILEDHSANAWIETMFEINEYFT